MKAVQINNYGGIEVLELDENAPKPRVAGGQILVEVHAASLNPFDWKVRAGYVKNYAPLNFPATLGGDFAGIVQDVGEGAKDFKTGDEVYGSALVLGGGSGSLAELTSANTGNIALKPKSASFDEAAALPLVGASAIQALENHIKLQSGQKILIHGGTGGIGHIAVQLAKAIGAYVATTVSPDDKDFAKSLGADKTIDYKNEKFDELLKDFDAVFDTVGGETTKRSFTVLKKGGVIVSMLGQPDEKLAKEYGVTAISQSTTTDARHLKRLTELVDSGKIKVSIDKTFPLAQVKEAFRHLEESHPRGKVAVHVR